MEEILDISTLNRKLGKYIDGPLLDIRESAVGILHTLY